jgi:hypothetical protein
MEQIAPRMEDLQAKIKCGLFSTSKRHFRGCFYDPDSYAEPPIVQKEILPRVDMDSLGLECPESTA